MIREIKTYNLQGKKVTQAELKFNQIKELAALIDKLTLEDLAKGGVTAFLAYLDKDGLFEDYFDIILVLKADPRRPVSEVVEHHLGSVAST